MTKRKLINFFIQGLQVLGIFIVGLILSIIASASLFVLSVLFLTLGPILVLGIIIWSFVEFGDEL